MRSRKLRTQNWISLLEMSVSFSIKGLWHQHESSQGPEQSKSQKPLSVVEGKPDNISGSHDFPEKLDEEEVEVEDWNSYLQRAASSTAWVARFNKADKGIQCDMSWWQDTEQARSPEPSPAGSRMGTGRKSRPLALS